MSKEMVRIRPWGRVFLLVAAPMRLLGWMNHDDVVALKRFIAGSAARSHQEEEG